MTVDGNSSLPFSESKIEEVFASDGEVSAISMAVYYNHTLIPSTLSLLCVKYVYATHVPHVQPRLIAENQIAFMYLFISSLLKDSAKSIMKHCLYISVLIHLTKTFRDKSHI